jgi:hypothetical protein
VYYPFVFPDDRHLLAGYQCRETDQQEGEKPPIHRETPVWLRLLAPY